jgi:hypothetical protein
MLTRPQRILALSRGYSFVGGGSQDPIDEISKRQKLKGIVYTSVSPPLSLSLFPCLCVILNGHRSDDEELRAEHQRKDAVQDRRARSRRTPSFQLYSLFFFFFFDTSELLCNGMT